METSATRFVEHDGVNIAWQVFGDGPAEIVFVPGWVSNLDLYWLYRQRWGSFSELAGFARAAIYDKPGTGLSDPVDEPPPAEIHVEQLIAVGQQAAEPDIWVDAVRFISKDEAEVHWSPTLVGGGRMPMHGFAVLDDGVWKVSRVHFHQTLRAEP